MMVDDTIAQDFEREYEIARNPNHPEHLMPEVPFMVRSVLDVGCGAGQTLAAIQARYPHVVTVVGVDQNAAAIAWGQQRWPTLSLFVKRGEDMFMIGRLYDLVLARLSLQYMEIPFVVSLMTRGLRPYGRVWLVTQSWRRVVREGWHACIARRFSRVAFTIYVLMNGLWFHVTGGLFRCPIGGRLESFQTERRMRALLSDAGCSNITYERRGDFAVITAQGK